MSAGPAEGAGSAGAADAAPLRVTNLELFFDLVFAFILTQLTALLTAPDHVAAGIVQVLLIFGLLWWMYGAYAWLTNARPPVHTAERLLLLVAMAGYLTVALAIPDGFGRSGLALGLGYLIVVLVHCLLYFRPGTRHSGCSCGPGRSGCALRPPCWRSRRPRPGQRWHSRCSWRCSPSSWSRCSSWNGACRT